MDNQQLEKQITAKKIEAGQKEICNKARIIAKFLGTHIPIVHDKESGSESFYPTHNYNGSDLSIKTSSIFTGDGDSGVYSSSTTISINNETVYIENGGNITSYISGTWELKLDELFSKAKEQEERKKDKKVEEDSENEQAKNANIKKNWGL